MDTGSVAITTGVGAVTVDCARGSELMALVTTSVRKTVVVTALTSCSAKSSKEGGSASRAAAVRPSRDGWFVTELHQQSEPALFDGGYGSCGYIGHGTCGCNMSPEKAGFLPRDWTLPLSCCSTTAMDVTRPMVAKPTAVARKTFILQLYRVDSVLGVVGWVVGGRWLVARFKADAGCYQ